MRPSKTMANWRIAALHSKGRHQRTPYPSAGKCFSPRACTRIPTSARSHPPSTAQAAFQTVRPMACPVIIQLTSQPGFVLLVRIASSHTATTRARRPCRPAPILQGAYSPRKLRASTGAESPHPASHSGKNTPSPAMTGTALSCPFGTSRL